MGNNEHYFLFDFDEATHLVKYKSDKDLGDEIANAVEAHVDAEDSEYMDFIDDVMTLMNVEWEKVPCRVCRV